MGSKLFEEAMIVFSITGAIAKTLENNFSESELKAISRDIYNTSFNLSSNWPGKTYERVLQRIKIKLHAWLDDSRHLNERGAYHPLLLLAVVIPVIGNLIPKIKKYKQKKAVGILQEKVSNFIKYLEELEDNKIIIEEEYERAYEIFKEYF